MWHIKRGPLQLWAFFDIDVNIQKKFACLFLQVLSKLEVIRSDAIKQCKEEASIQVSNSKDNVFSRQILPSFFPPPYSLETLWFFFLGGGGDSLEIQGSTLSKKKAWILTHWEAKIYLE